MARDKKRKRAEAEESSESGGGDEREENCSSDDSEDEQERCFTAVAEGDLHALEQLHANGIDLRVGDEEEGDTPFCVACRFGHLEMAKWLSGVGVPMDARNHHGDGALHEASLHGHLGVVEWLLSQLPPSALEESTESGMTPVAYAALHGHTLVLDKLVSAGSSLTCVNSLGHSLMHLACSEGQLDTAKRLKELGARSDLLDLNGRSALHIAAGASQLGAVKWLAQSCGTGVDTPDHNGATPLHFAAAAGDSAIAEWLLSAGADAARANADDNTVLHYACQAGLLELTEALLARVSQRFEALYLRSNLKTSRRPHFRVGCGQIAEECGWRYPLLACLLGRP